jgi:hypothetical protein
VTQNGDRLRFDPNDEYETMTTGDWTQIYFAYTIRDTGGLTDTAGVSMTVSGVNDAPVFISEPVSLSAQYSDIVTPTTVTVYDVDADGLSISQVGLPAGLSLAELGCDDGMRPSTCTAQISGAVQAPAGTYAATLSVSDGQITTTQGITVVVTVEEATVAFEDDNPTAVQVTAPESNASQPFELVVYVEELEPDVATYLAAAGDIALANVSMTLMPVGPGSSVPGTCTPILIDDAVDDYGDVLKVVCAFAGAPVNTYAVEVVVDGGYYVGFGEEVVVVYDPSLGFTTGGGWFYWPGSEDGSSGYPGDKTNFGYSMKYNKSNLKNIQGSLLLIRHLPDGSKYRIKSNALEATTPSWPMWRTTTSRAAASTDSGWRRVTRTAL